MGTVRVRSICAPGIGQGTTVGVAVSPRNRKRVTIDVGQGETGGIPRPGGALSIILPSDVTGPFPVHQARFDELIKLAELHRRGVLTDTEFAAAKARVLGA